jgi:hypothetical protein
VSTIKSSAAASLWEVDLCGTYLDGISPTYHFSLQDYKCHHPPPTAGAKVLFHKELLAAPSSPGTLIARRVVSNYMNSNLSEATGTICSLLEFHGFVTIDGTNENVYFSIKSAYPAAQIGDRVAFSLLKEPPVSANAGKLLAVSLEPLKA